MELKSNKFYIVNPLNKEVYDKEFDDKQEAENLIVRSRLDRKIASGRQLNALMKSRHFELTKISISSLIEKAERMDNMEKERIAELKRRGKIDEHGHYIR